MLRRIVFLLAKALMCSAFFFPMLCCAQGTSAEIWDAGRADVSVSFQGYFSTSGTNNGVTQKASDSAGAIGSLRYTFARYLTAEVNYGHVRGTEYFTSATMQSSVHTGVHEVSAAYVANVWRRAKLEAFVLAGGGAMVFNPIVSGTTTVGTQSQTKPAVLYGAGVNYALNRHVALRLEYRGLYYATPSFQVETVRSNTSQSAAAPAFGLVYRF